MTVKKCTMLVPCYCHAFYREQSIVSLSCCRRCRRCCPGCGLTLSCSFQSFRSIAVFILFSFRSRASLSCSALVQSILLLVPIVRYSMPSVLAPNGQPYQGVGRFVVAADGLALLGCRENPPPLQLSPHSGLPEIDFSVIVIVIVIIVVAIGLRQGFLRDLLRREGPAVIVIRIVIVICPRLGSILFLRIIVVTVTIL